MFSKIPKPSKTSLIFLDTSVVLDYMLGDLHIPGFGGLLEKNIKELVDMFSSRSIRFKITPTIKQQLKTRKEKVVKAAQKYEGMTPYLLAIIVDKAMNRYEKLQTKITEDTSPPQRLNEVTSFYEANKDKDEFKRCRASKPNPTPLPEESDMRILAEVANFPNSYLITADCDFAILDEEIFETFSIYIISHINMLQVTNYWDWTWS